MRRFPPHPRQGPAMPRLVPLCILLASLLLSTGCGGGGAVSKATSPTIVGPHGGPGFALPGKKGYAEVVIETTRSTKAGSDVILSVFFLQPDGKASMAPPPSQV